MAPSNAQTLYVTTTDAGVFRSTDGGGTWQPASGGLPETYLPGLAVDPNDPLVAYAGGSVVYKTSDGGASWVQAGSLPPSLVNSIAVDPSDSQVVYAGSYMGVFMSTDGGGAWSEVDPTGLGSQSVQELMLHPSGKLFAGTWGASVRMTRLPV